MNLYRFQRYWLKQYVSLPLISSSVFVTFVTFMDVTLRSVGCRLKLQALCTTATRVAHAEARCAYAAGRVEGSAAPPRDPPVSSHAFFTWLRVAAAAAALLLEKLYCYCLCGAIAENE